MKKFTLTLVAAAVATGALHGCGKSEPTAQGAAAPATAAAEGSGAGDCNTSGKILLTPGASAQVKFQSFGPDGKTVVMSAQNKYTVKDGGAFAGQTGLIEVAGEGSGTLVDPKGGPGMPLPASLEKRYFGVGAAEVAEYGHIVTSAVSGSAASPITATHSPAPAWPSAPTLNVPYSQTYTMTNGAVKAQFTETRTYLGVEQVTVPAGSFAACKIRTETVSNTKLINVIWTIAGGKLKGLQVKAVDDTGKLVMEALSVAAN